MHLLPGPLISAIAEGQRIEISFGPKYISHQHFFRGSDENVMLTSANKISILLMPFL